MSTPPYMQLYVSDYLGDTRALTTEQHGAYLLLLMCAWNNGGILPNDAKKLARYTGCTPSRWAKISPEVLEFFEVTENEIISPRLILELEKASEKSIKRADVGSRGGKAKSLKDKDRRLAKANDLLWHSPEPEPEPEKKEVSVAKATSPRPTVGAFDQFWLAHPRKVGKGAARKAFMIAWRKIDGPDPLAILMTALAAVKPIWAKLEPEHIPHPAKWLNQERWEDDPEPDRRVTRTDAPRLTPEQQAALDAYNARMIANATDAGPGPVDAAGTLDGGSGSDGKGVRRFLFGEGDGPGAIHQAVHHRRL